jgi:uncharacterized protein YeeX (DUF496 family)
MTYPSGRPSAVTCVEVKEMDQRIRDNRKRIRIDYIESDMNISHSARSEKMACGQIDNIRKVADFWIKCIKYQEDYTE